MNVLMQPFKTYQNPEIIPKSDSNSNTTVYNHYMPLISNKCYMKKIVS